MKYFTLPLTFFFISITLYAQTAQEEFEKFKQAQKAAFSNYAKESKSNYEHFRDSVNAEYAEFMRKAWEAFYAVDGTPAPQSPEPDEPTVAEPYKQSSSESLPIERISLALEPEQQSLRPISSLSFATENEDPSSSEIPNLSNPANYKFLFYNTECYVNLDISLLFSLPDASENSIAQIWENLSNNMSDNLIISCLKLREQLNLCDWGYMQLLKTLSENFLGKGSNEAVLLQMYILTQSGYKVRIARTPINRLTLLVPFREILYQYSFLELDNIKYYFMNKEMKSGKYYVFNHEFPREQYFVWRATLPRLAEKLNPPKSFFAKKYPEASASIQTNQNLLDFYNDYPLIFHWNLYVRTGLSESVKQKLYPALRSAIENKTNLEAAELLLNFCQTAFDYQTCKKQFGYDRPFFADENFFFPYNNFNHRATFFALLIKDLLHLEVILLSYAEHLAVAVHFPENIEGDYFNLNGKKFIMCDPTYINAHIGMTIDKLKKTGAEIIKI